MDWETDSMLRTKFHWQHDMVTLEDSLHTTSDELELSGQPFLTVTIIAVLYWSLLMCLPRIPCFSDLHFSR